MNFDNTVKYLMSKSQWNSAITACVKELHTAMELALIKQEYTFTGGDLYSTYKRLCNVGIIVDEVEYERFLKNLDEFVMKQIDASEHYAKLVTEDTKKFIEYLMSFDMVEQM